MHRVTVQQQVNEEARRIPEEFIIHDMTQKFASFLQENDLLTLTKEKINMNTSQFKLEGFILEKKKLRDVVRTISYLKAHVSNYGRKHLDYLDNILTNLNH